MTVCYPAVFDRREGEIVVRFRDIPEALTGASDETEARALAADALEEAILAYRDEGREVPAPSVPRDGDVLIALP